MFKKIIFLYMLFFFSSHVSALVKVSEKVIYAKADRKISKECSSVEDKKLHTRIDMRADFGSIRHQDGFGWCFAFAGADLFYQYAKYNPNLFDPPQEIKKIEDLKVFSAASMASNFYRYAPIKGWTYEEVPPVIPLNSTELLDSFDPIYSGGKIDEMINQYRCEETSYFVCSEESMFSTAPSSKWQMDSEKTLADCDLDEQLLWDAEMKLLIKNAKEIINTVNSLCEYKFNPQNVPYAKTTSRLESSQQAREELIDFLDKRLEESQAVAIMHSLDALYHKDSLLEKEADDTSVVVGRQLVTGPFGCRVEYMLRDSSSSNCQAYKNSDLNHVRCELTDKGPTIWVSREWLLANVAHMTYLEKIPVEPSECHE